MMEKIAVVIPAYRAEKSIAKVIGGVPAYVSYIVVVDDCSPDATFAKVQALALQDLRIHLVKHEKNLGVGGAMLTGYAKAKELKADIWIKIDSDDQMDLTFLPQLITPILSGRADFTKGNRFLMLSELAKMPLMRRFGNFGLSFLTKVASGYWDIFDPTNGYTAIHASAFESIRLNKIARRFFFESSLLIELGMSRAVIMDVSMPARYQDENSNLSSLKSLFEFPPKLFLGLLRRIITQYYYRDFGIVSVLLPLACFLIGFGTYYGLSSWFIASQNNQTTPSGTVMLAALPIIIGVQMLLQALAFDIQNVPREPISLANKRLQSVTNMLFNYTRNTGICE